MPKQEARFWARVDKHGPTLKPELGPCWLWTGCRVGRGYGHIVWDGKAHKAHRVAWFLETGEWPTPCGLHKCDNPPCVRFSHLFEGNHLTNAQDRESKGRGRHAAKTHCPKGHPYATVIAGTRRCRECSRAKCKQQYHNSRRKQ